MKQPKSVRSIHPAYALALVGALAAASAATVPLAPVSLPPTEHTQIHIGPRCPLVWEVGLPHDGVWLLPPAKNIVPFELVQHGYPDDGPRRHDLVIHVTATAYTSTRDQTDSTPFITASMARVRPGIIAMSRDLLKRYTPGAPFDFGDQVEIIGLGVFQVEDTMNRRYSKRIDIWLPDRQDAYAWGVQELLIGAMPPGSPAAPLAQPHRWGLTEPTGGVLLADAGL